MCAHGKQLGENADCLFDEQDEGEPGIANGYDHFVPAAQIMQPRPMGVVASRGEAHSAQGLDQRREADLCYDLRLGVAGLDDQDVCQVE